MGSSVCIEVGVQLEVIPDALITIQFSSREEWGMW